MCLAREQDSRKRHAKRCGESAAGAVLNLTICLLPSHRRRLDDEVRGRSPGSRVLAFALLPRALAPVVRCVKARRLQLRGQPRNCAARGRAPHSRDSCLAAGIADDWLTLRLRPLQREPARGVVRGQSRRGVERRAHQGPAQYPGLSRRAAEHEAPEGGPHRRRGRPLGHGVRPHV